MHLFAKHVYVRLWGYKNEGDIISALKKTKAHCEGQMSYTHVQWSAYVTVTVVSAGTETERKGKVILLVGKLIRTDLSLSLSDMLDVTPRPDGREEGDACGSGRCVLLLEKGFLDRALQTMRIGCRMPNRNHFQTHHNTCNIHPLKCYGLC